MKNDPNRLDIVLSMYPKTTEIFSKFKTHKDVKFEPFEVIFQYETMYLKDFLNISIKVNGKTANYNIGFIVKHCEHWDTESRFKRKNIEYGVLMSEFKKDYYKRVFHSAGDDGILDQIFKVVSKYIADGNRVNELILEIPGFELYAQSGYLHNNPGHYVEYGETDVYIIDAIVVDKVGLVWAD